MKYTRAGPLGRTQLARPEDTVILRTCEQVEGGKDSSHLDSVPTPPSSPDKGSSFLPSAVVVFWEILSEVWHGGGESACPGTLGSLTLSVSNLDLDEVTQIRTVSSASHPETTSRRIDHNRNSLTSILRVPVTVLLSPTSNEYSFPYVEVPLSLFFFLFSPSHQLLDLLCIAQESYR